MTSMIYNKAVHAEAVGAIDYDTDTFYGMLLTDAYTPDKDAHEFRDDIEGSEASGAGYSAGGVAVSVSVTRVDASDRTEIQLGAATFTGITVTNARHLVYYKRRGGASSADELVAVNTFGSNITLAGGGLTVAASTIRKTNT